MAFILSFLTQGGLVNHLPENPIPSRQKHQDYPNSFSHFKTFVDGFGIHYIQQKGEGKDPVPLLLSHGWPDSFVRFLKIIPLLTKEDENGLSFDVVITSIEGYGFSDIPREKGMKDLAEGF